MDDACALVTVSRLTDAVLSTMLAFVKLQRSWVLVMAVGGVVGGVKADVYTGDPFTHLKPEIIPLNGFDDPLPKTPT